jgi:hypothetical protein
VDNAAGVAAELACRQPSELLERSRTQRSGVLLPVAFCIGQQELWCELERLKKTAALSYGALKQAFRERRSHEDADRY